MQIKDSNMRIKWSKYANKMQINFKKVHNINIVAVSFTLTRIRIYWLPVIWRFRNNSNLEGSWATLGISICFSLLLDLSAHILQLVMHLTVLEMALEIIDTIVIFAF